MSAASIALPAYANDGIHAGKKQPGALAAFVVREDAALSPKADIDDPYGREIFDAIKSEVRR